MRSRWRRLVPSAGSIAHDARAPDAPKHARQSRRNIAAHYDLGNDFYRLFLDETMTYSSAVFTSPRQSLADAQRNKYQRIADGAGLTKGMHVLEIGSGWGGFALYAAGELGCRVTSITISREQHDLARRAGPRGRPRGAGRHPAAGLSRHQRHLRRHRVDRDAGGRRGRVLRDFFSACDKALAAGGRLSLQSITVPDAALRGAATRRQLDPDVHLPGRPLPITGGHREGDA